MKNVGKSELSKHPVSVALGLVALRRLGLYAQVTATHNKECGAGKPGKDGQRNG